MRIDWSLLLGVLGILVSIIVGWLTYRLANRRAYSQRYMDAKATVLQELSKSLGEDSVPATGILEATIRSVLREIGDPKIKINIGEILDDLIRQVTSDPFLDSERRRKLQGDIEKVRSEPPSKEFKEPSEESGAYARGPARANFSSLFIGLGAMFLTLTGFVVAFLSDEGAQVKVKKLLTHNQGTSAIIFGVLAGSITLMVMFYFLDNQIEEIIFKILRWRWQKKRSK